MGVITHRPGQDEMLQVLGECLLEVLLNALGLPAPTGNCSGSYHSSLVAVIAAEPTVPTLCCPSRDIGPRGGAFCAAGAGWLGWATEGAEMPWSLRVVGHGSSSIISPSPH